MIPATCCISRLQLFVFLALAIWGGGCYQKYELENKSTIKMTGSISAMRSPTEQSCFISRFLYIAISIM